jgi:hypothetical protein
VCGPKKGHALMAAQCDKFRALSSKNHMYMAQKKGHVCVAPQQKCPRALTLERRVEERELQVGGSCHVYNSSMQYVQNYSNSLMLIHTQHARHGLSDGETITLIVAYAWDHMQIWRNINKVYIYIYLTHICICANVG